MATVSTPMSSTAEPANLMEAIVSLAKRRGFIYPYYEIYGGLNGFFDYGPLGSELKKNIRDCWWNDMVRRRDDIVGLESSIIMHPKVWEASGHVAGFSDPLVDCKVSKQRYRADQLFFSPVVVALDEASALNTVVMLTEQGVSVPDNKAVAALAAEGNKPVSILIGYVSALESERVSEELQEA